MRGAPPSVESLRVKLFADGARLDELRALSENPLIQGFTTNPTLMRKAGVVDFEEFAREAAAIAGSRPVSFEVFSDEFDEMERQAETIAGWGPNVFVKIPVTDTSGASSAALVRRLAARGIKLNVTALLTVEQVEAVAACLEPEVPAFVSVFAGRIADTGRDPVPTMKQAAVVLRELPHALLLWASPRELLNVFQADEAGCDVIAATSDLLGKLVLVGKDLEQFSVETVRMFYDDAAAAAYAIGAPVPTTTVTG